MDAHLNAVVQLRIERTIKNLQKNRMEAFFAPTAQDVVPLVDKLCAEGEVVSVGGSMTLFETGVIEHLKSGKYNYLDRYAQDANVDEVFRQAFSCDTYLTSTNAITESGELYNVDGNGNRVAAMIFGPKSVIVVAGYNKIVADLDAARQRVRDIAAPANAQRLQTQTPCRIQGTCSDCRSEQRMCISHCVLGWQRQQGRIKVILVGEQLGY